MKMSIDIPEWLGKTILEIQKAEHNGPQPSRNSIVVGALEDRFQAFRPQPVEVHDERFR